MTWIDGIILLRRTGTRRLKWRDDLCWIYIYIGASSIKMGDWAKPPRISTPESASSYTSYVRERERLAASRPPHFGDYFLSKRLRWQAANHSCHCFDRAFLFAGACVCCVMQQTQAPANRNARAKQRQPWSAACQRKRLRFLRFSFTQRTQRKRLRLNGNRAW